MLPDSFEAWRTCIVRDCGINLTKEFAAQRLAVYEDKNHPETKKFIALYGAQHLSNVIRWYRKV